MTFDLTGITIPSEALGATKRRIHWIMADSNANTAGFFYTKTKPDAQDSANPEWNESNFRDDYGWQAEIVQFIPVFIQKRPFVKRDGVRVFTERYEKGGKFYTEVAAVVHGFAKPVILTFKGATGMAWRDAYAEYDRWLAVAGRAAKPRRKMPVFSFWMTLRPEMKNGRPVLRELFAGNRKNLFVIDPVNPSLEELRRLYVGNDLVRSLSESYNDYKALVAPAEARQEAQEEDDEFPPF